MKIKQTMKCLLDSYLNVIRLAKPFIWKFGAWLYTLGPFSLLFGLFLISFLLFKYGNWQFDKLVYFAVSVLGAIVALFAFYLNKTKVNLDLFDRRFKIYEGCKHALEIVVQNGNIEWSRSLELLKKYDHESQFFYGSEITDYIDHLYRKCNRLNDTNRQLKDLEMLPAGSEERAKVSEENCELLIYLTEQLKELPKVFSVYLSFKHIY